MNMREAFEAWTLTHPMRMHLDSLTGTDNVTCYAATNTQMAWESFQAGAAHAAKVCAALCHETSESLAAEMDIRAEFPEVFK